MRPHRQWAPRPTEALLLLVVSLFAALGFALASAGEAARQGADPLPAVAGALWPPLVIALSLFLVHFLLRLRGFTGEQILLPAVGLLHAMGLIMIWRLLPAAFTWQQITRGWLPGLLVVALLAARPQWVERLRRDWPMTASALGLFLLILTAVFGQVDQSGARLAVKLGPLPAIQTSEPIKLALIIFLAWYIEGEGPEAEGRARPLGWFRLPALRYFVPGTLYVALAVLALFRMSDLGAVLILGGLFVAMLYAGFETRVFLPVAGIGAGLALAAGLLLGLTAGVPAVVQARWAAYLDPWSQQLLVLSGHATGITIASGPGYQIQQSLYAVMAGGVTGTGLGFGQPGNVPLSHSDFIFAGLVEEMGGAAGLAALALFAVVCLRVLRTASRLPRLQAFERLLLVGIAVHFFLQVFVMAGATLNLVPVTGLTVPFMSLGGVALLVNLTEAGLALALAQRLRAGTA
jgi:cell division protein FtsW (lipid II flippase)